MSEPKDKLTEAIAWLEWKPIGLFEHLSAK